MTTSVSQPATDEPTIDDRQHDLPDVTGGDDTDDVADDSHDGAEAGNGLNDTRTDMAPLWLAVTGLAVAVVLAWALSLLGADDQELRSTDPGDTAANVVDAPADDPATGTTPDDDTVPADDAPPDDVDESDSISSEAVDVTDAPGTGADDGEPVEPVTINEELSLDPITFEVLSATITEEGQSVLDEAVAYMKADPDVVVEIAGHTDSDGDPSDNLRLSQTRAEAVRAYLEAGGIDGSRMTAVGYGADRPIASNDTDEGKAQNRRIEFVIR